MSESGLRQQWETVYAHSSVDHILTGHAYARAMRAHMLSAGSMAGLLLKTTSCISEEYTVKLASLYDVQLNHRCQPEELNRYSASSHIPNSLMIYSNMKL